jgi:uncharacterized coiled-coil protein SlyX
MRHLSGEGAPGMCVDEAASRGHEFEIGIRFRRMMEERIARLETNAASDEATVEQLENRDHIRRQLRLVAAQRDEAERVRRFLNQCGVRALG